MYATIVCILGLLQNVALAVLTTRNRKLYDSIRVLTVYPIVFMLKLIDLFTLYIYICLLVMCTFINV